MTESEVQVMQEAVSAIQATQKWIETVTKRVDAWETRVKMNEDSLFRMMGNQELLVNAVRRMSEGKKPHTLPIEIDLSGHTSNGTEVR